MSECIKCGCDTSWYVSTTDEGVCLDCVATERDDLQAKLKCAHDALRHMYSMGSTALDVRTCTCGSCTNARTALADAKCNVCYPPGERCWKTERDEIEAKLCRAVEACVKSIRSPGTMMPPDAIFAIRNVIAENADIVKEIEAGKEVDGGTR